MLVSRRWEDATVGGAGGWLDGTGAKNGAVVLDWAAASFVEAEQNYRWIVDYDQLWMLKARPTNGRK